MIIDLVGIIIIQTVIITVKFLREKRIFLLYKIIIYKFIKRLNISKKTVFITVNNN